MSDVKEVMKKYEPELGGWAYDEDQNEACNLRTMVEGLMKSNVRLSSRIQSLHIKLGQAAERLP